MACPKIAIEGAHGTGKTALIYHVAAELKERFNLHVGVTRESARFSPYIIAEETVPEMEINLLGRLLQEETELVRSHELVLCDRTPAEIVAYSELLFSTVSDEVHNNYFRAIEGLTRLYMPSYSLVLRTTKLYDPSDTNDPLRPKDTEFQRRTHAKIEEILNRMGVLHVDLPETNPLDFVIENVRDLLNLR